MFAITTFGQKTLTDANFGFENLAENQSLPTNWEQWVTPEFIVKVDNRTKKSGNNSILIEPQRETNPKSIGCIASFIPTNFEGNELQLRASLKLKDAYKSYLFLQIEDEEMVLAFSNNETNQLTGTSDWAEYSINLAFPEDSKKITFGVCSKGKGQVWADDFQLLMDGKNISQAPPIKVAKATLDKEFDTGSRINSISLNQKRIEDLAVLGKVWGFLKYYHPTIARGDYNWDYELFRVLPKILSAKNKMERNQILVTWAESLGDFEKGENEKIDPAKIKLSPDLTWISEKILGIKLVQVLQSIKYAKRTGKNYYVGAYAFGGLIIKNEAVYESMSYPDAGFRLLSLYRYWNIIQYYFPNRHLIGEDWNNVLAEFVPKFVNSKTELAYKKNTLALISRINDTHANIIGKDKTLDAFRGVNFAPLIVSFVENKAVVTGFWEPSLGEKSGLKFGDVIESINGKTVTQIVKENLDFNPASNYPTKLREVAKHLLRTNENSLKVKFRRANEQKEITVECFSEETTKINFQKLRQKSIPPFRLFSPEIAYLYPGSLKPGETTKYFPEIAKTKGLIVDMRSYPADDIIYSLGEFLLPKPTNFVKVSNSSITTPGLFSFKTTEIIGKDNKDYYQGKVVILINEITQSAAEYTTMALQTAPNVTVIGSTTSGADGNVAPFDLPGGISTRISGIGVYYPDGRETQRVGIIPDLELKPTIKGIAEGRDELLEKAVEVIKPK